MNEVTQAVLACVGFGNRTLTDSKSVTALGAIHNSVAIIFHSIALGIANDPAYRRWQADPTNPGYLVTTFDGFQLRAPWNLMADLPDEAFLAEFVSYAIKLKTQGESAICLSGSLLTKSGAGSIGDVDLCEYVSDTARDFSDVAREAIAVEESGLICFQVKAHVAEGLVPAPRVVTVIRPWQESREPFLQSAKGSANGRCDFAALSASEGAIEVTKMVLHVDGRYTDTEGTWDLSFPFQEAALTASTSWVPRRLVPPRSLGRYAVWLYGQVLLHKDDAPVKAAKRALALARLLQMPALANLAIDCLKRDDLALRSAITARLTFHESLAAIADDALTPFRQRLATTIGDLAKNLLAAAVANGRLPPATGAAPTLDAVRSALGEPLPDASERLEPLVTALTTFLEPAVILGRY